MNGQKCLVMRFRGLGRDYVNPVGYKYWLEKFQVLFQYS